MCMSPKHGLGRCDEPFRGSGAVQSTGRRVWNEARRSVLTGLAIAVIFLALLALYACLMPPLSVCLPFQLPYLTLERDWSSTTLTDSFTLQEADWDALRHFPPLSISQLSKQRDVVQRYASQHPVSAHLSS